MEKNEGLEQHGEFKNAYLAMKAKVNEVVNVMTKGMSKEQMKQLFRMRDKESLQELLKEVGLKNENYEVCQAIKEVLEEK